MNIKSVVVFLWCVIQSDRMHDTGQSNTSTDTTDRQGR